MFAAYTRRGVFLLCVCICVVCPGVLGSAFYYGFARLQGKNIVDVLFFESGGRMLLLFALLLVFCLLPLTGERQISFFTSCSLPLGQRQFWEEGEVFALGLIVLFSFVACVCFPWRFLS